MRFPPTKLCCGLKWVYCALSSVVEHSSDKGKVEGSIPSARTDMDLTIGTYTGGDRPSVIAGLVELQKHEVALHDTRRPSTIELAEKYLDSLLSSVDKKSGVFLCAHSSESLLGFIVCWIERDENVNETADSTTYGYICDAFVFEQYRGQGIFRQLNAEAERHLKQFPEVKRIRLNALANNEAALRAYRSAGYSDYEILLEKRTQ